MSVVGLMECGKETNQLVKLVLVKEIDSDGDDAMCGGDCPGCSRVAFQGWGLFLEQVAMRWCFSTELQTVLDKYY